VREGIVDHEIEFGHIGVEVEVGHGSRKVPTPWADNRRHDRINRWGHRPLARP
jgi:hypothetical protein